jgi:hypothetical protein
MHWCPKQTLRGISVGIGLFFANQALQKSTKVRDLHWEIVDPLHWCPMSTLPLYQFIFCKPCMKGPALQKSPK